MCEERDRQEESIEGYRASRRREEGLPSVPEGPVEAHRFVGPGVSYEAGKRVYRGKARLESLIEGMSRELAFLEALNRALPGEMAPMAERGLVMLVDAYAGRSGLG